jgi:tetratricopeptide (TPR) repeat protein
MKKLSFVLLLFLTAQKASAETIVLSDRSTIEAKIIARTDSDITVKIDGVALTYLLFEVKSIDGVPVDLPDSHADADIAKLLRARGYPEHSWSDIEREFKGFLVSIDFYGLKNKLKQAQSDPEGLRTYVTQLGGLIKQQGYLDLKGPKPFIKLLINSLGDEDIFSVIDSSPLPPIKKEEEKRESLACSAISQLASIILDLSGIDSKIAIAFDHVFNIIPFDSRHMLFADFSNGIFDIVDVNAFYKTRGKYRVLKEEQRLAPALVWDINKKWDQGYLPVSLRQTLNLNIYFYIYIADNNSATAILYTNRGNDYALKGNIKKALENYAHALKINPNIAGVYSNRGLVFAALGDLNRAILDYNKALEINPDDIDAYNDRGLAYKNMNNFTRAISDYNKALEINPNSFQVYINRAACYYYLKDYAKAQEDVYKAQVLGYK